MRMHRVASLLIATIVATPAPAAVSNAIDIFDVDEAIAHGGHPIRPLRAPKYEYFSMAPSFQPQKPGENLALMDLFEGGPAARRPLMPDFTPTRDTPGIEEWTPTADDARTAPSGLPAPVPAPATLSPLLLIAAVRRRRRRA